MDNRRIIGKILLNGHWAIQSKGFNTYLPVGKPEILAEFLDHWQVDEILVIDRLATREGRCINSDIIRAIVEVCRTPLTVGGGIRNVKDAENLVNCGADRLCLNASAVEQPQLIEQLSQIFGKQAIVAHCDVAYEGRQAVRYDHLNKTNSTMNVHDFVVQMASLGAGELVLHSVARDGAKNGYDIDLYKAVVPLVNIPVVASGGYGQPEHLKSVLDTGVAAIAIGNQLNYMEHSISVIKSAMDSHSIRPTSIAYASNLIQADGRLAKTDDDLLDEMRFHKREGRWL